MFDEMLKKYHQKGFFAFKVSEIYKLKCNAPKEHGGVYLIYQIQDNKEFLLYIGSSGQRRSDGSLKIRKGGMYDRLVNGYHPNRFGETVQSKRQYAFPRQMIRQGINEIKIYWWVTYDYNSKDFPTDVETLLRESYRNQFNCLPDWHN